MQEISARMFFPGDTDGRLSQEASSLHWRPGQIPKEFWLVTVAGTKVEMFLWHTEMEAFGEDVAYWEFKPTDKSLDWFVTVWND